MTPTENANRLNDLVKGLSPRDREILEGTTSTILGAVKTVGQVGLLALVVASSRAITELKTTATERSVIGEAVLAFHTQEAQS